MYILFILFILLSLGIGVTYLFFIFRKNHRIQQSDSMRYLLIRIQNEVGSDPNKSTIGSMKQNLELMNQFLKNMMSLWQNDVRHKLLGQPYISLELIGEEELIKFVL